MCLSNISGGLTTTNRYYEARFAEALTVWTTVLSIMSEHQGHRRNNFSKTEHGYTSRNGTYNHHVARANYPQVYGMHQSQVAANMLAQGLQGMTVQDSHFPPSKGPYMATAAPQYAGLALNTTFPGALWGANSHLMYPGTHAYPPGNHQQSPGLYSPMTAQYLHHGYPQQHDNSPASQSWTLSHATGDVPTLITPRRDSISSNENDAPGTPSYSSYPYQPGVSIVNRSPSGFYTHSSPSPSHMVSQYGMPMVKTPESRSIPSEIHALLNKEPAIPPAIPAPSSPLKPLDRALENLRGETNVYIRGLHPDTTDEMLESWGRRFGDIRSSKSIIDHGTGLCKGCVAILFSVTRFVTALTVPVLASSNITATKTLRIAFEAFTTLVTKSASLVYVTLSVWWIFPAANCCFRNRSTPNSRPLLMMTTPTFTSPTCQRV